MLGSGIFVLPGLATAKTGPWVWMAYLFAGITVLPAALSKSELATAMPTSGGTYVYLERAFGPLVGTISGVGLWLSLLLKSAFALVGFSAYFAVLVDVPLRPVALVLLVGVTLLNVMGVSIISKLQKYILTGVLLSLTGICLAGIPSMDLSVMDVGLTKGTFGFFEATAFVYVSYAGVTKIAAIAEEVKNPGKNLPRGILISWFLVMTIYVLVVLSLVTNIPTEQLIHFEGGEKADLHPIYTLAKSIGGSTVGLAAAIIAVITMVSMATAGLLAASRFPFAMSRDQLLPDKVKAISPRFKTPVVSILLTATVMAICILFLPIQEIAKLASALIILGFMAECCTVIVLRESSVQWYQPPFRSPMYPWMQLLGMLVSIGLLIAMGISSLYVTLFTVVVGVVTYYGYGRSRADRQGVIGTMGSRPDLLNKPVVAPQGESKSKGAVLVPMFGSERSPESLVEMGAALAQGRQLDVNMVQSVPVQYLGGSSEGDPKTTALERRLQAMAQSENFEMQFKETLSRDIVSTVLGEVQQNSYEWVVMEDTGRAVSGFSFMSPIRWLNDHLNCNLAIFHDAGVRYFRQILVLAEPGPHDSLVVTTADHLAQVYNAELNFVCFHENGSDEVAREAKRNYVRQLMNLCKSESRVVEATGDQELSEIGELSSAYDLLVMGAAPDRGWMGRLFGTGQDRLVRDARCSVLALKSIDWHVFEPGEAQATSEETTDPDLVELTSEAMIVTGMQNGTKEKIFRRAAELIKDRYPKTGSIIVNAALWEREQLQNTHIKSGLALPHASLPASSEGGASIAIVTTAQPIDYGCENGDTVDVMIFTTCPMENRLLHLKVLTKISRLCSETDLLEHIRKARSPQEVMDAIRKSQAGAN